MEPFLNTLEISSSNTSGESNTSLFQSDSSYVYTIDCGTLGKYDFELPFLINYNYQYKKKKVVSDKSKYIYEVKW